MNRTITTPTGLTLVNPTIRRHRTTKEQWVFHEGDRWLLSECKVKEEAKFPEPDINGICWVYVHNGKMWSFYAVGQLLDTDRKGRARIKQSGLGTRWLEREAWRK